MPREPRRPIPREITPRVLDQSRRRCALCFWLKGDLTEKHGQIAHLDGNRDNCSEDNIAFLCMTHHSLYDSTTSQHKNYTIDEVKAARERLYEAIARNEHLATATPKTSFAAGTETDRQTLAALLEVMADSGSIDFLREHSFGGSFWWSQLVGIEQAVYRGGPEHEFLDPELEQLRVAFQTACNTFAHRIGINTFVLKSSVSDAIHGIPPEWHFQEPERFNRAVKELDLAAKNLCTAYDSLVRLARKKLDP